jgi:hypothetical protein
VRTLAASESNSAIRPIKAASSQAGASVLLHLSWCALVNSRDHSSECCIVWSCKGLQISEILLLSSRASFYLRKETSTLPHGDLGAHRQPESTLLYSLLLQSCTFRAC